YGLADFDLRHQWVSSNTRVVLELESSAGEKLAVKIDTAVEPSALWGAHTQDWVSRRASGIAPKIRKTKAGALAVHSDGSRIVVSDWVSGTSPRAPEDWWHVGSALARLHQIELAHNSFGVPYAAAVDELSRDFAGDSCTAAAESLIARIADLPLTPIAVIHGEPAASNLKIAAAGAMLLDWDQAGVGAVVLDLGFPLIREFVSSDLGFRTAEAEAFYSGYRSQAGRLPNLPRDVFTAGLFWAMRFMAFHDREGRWRRVEYAVAHEPALLRAIG
ncbi:MAG: phosphotransferase, partial [Mycobacterium sp.]|nr:phosphotransferase [Mycobacterium sp.]